MKKLSLLVGLLLTLVYATFAHGLNPNCGTQNSFTFIASDGVAGTATVVLVDNNLAPIVGVGAYSAVMTLPANGSTPINVPRVSFAQVIIRLTWADGYVSFSTSTSVICTGLPINPVTFDNPIIKGDSAIIGFRVTDESVIGSYNIKVSKDYINWETRAIILPSPLKKGHYTITIKL